MGFARSPVSSKRMLSLAANSPRASLVTPGARITSTNWRSKMARAVEASNSRLNAMIPPKADVGSVR